VPLYLLASTGIGAGFALVVISGKTILQEHSPNAMRGRVLSSQLFLSSVVSTLPLPLMGKLADVVGFQRAFALLAFIVLIIGIASVRHAIRNRGASPTPLAEAEPFESPRQGQGGATKSKRDI
jgi:MFS family permease